MRNFRRDRRGIVAPLVVGIPLIMVVTILWVVSMVPAAEVWDALTPMMPNTANTQSTMNMLHNAAGWTLLITVVGVLVWMGVWAFQREVVDIPA